MTCKRPFPTYRQAEAIYRNALETFSRERSPIQWAKIKNNLGSILSNLAQLVESPAQGDLLIEATIAFRDALEVLPKEEIGQIPSKQQFLEKNAEVQHFLIKAGFSIRSVSQHGLLCSSNLPIWAHISPLYVRLVFDKVLDIEQFQALCHETKEVYNVESLRNQTAAVVIDRPPNTGDLYQIFALRSQEGFTIIPLPLSMLTQARLDGCEQNKLLTQFDQYTGRVDLYDTRMAVTDVLSFFGRDALLAELKQRLTKGQAAMIFGVRKVGKSSLMGRLNEECGWPNATIDLEGHIGSLDHVYKEALEGWKSTISIFLPGLTLPDISLPNTKRSAELAQAFQQKVNDLLSLLLEQPKRLGIMLFLDEMGVLIDEPNYIEFASVLRSIAEDKRNRGRFAILMAGLDPTLNRLDRMVGGQKRNPFFQFFNEQPLALLAPQEVSKMIISIGGQMGVKYEPEALELLIKVGGGHPFLTRQLCSYTIRNKELPIIVNKKESFLAVKQYLRESRSYLSELWGIDLGGPPPGESAILTSLATTQPEEENILIPLDLVPKERRTLQIARDHLRDQGLIRQIEEKWECTIPLYRHWIQHYILSQPYEDILEAYQ